MKYSSSLIFVLVVSLSILNLSLLLSAQEDQQDLIRIKSVLDRGAAGEGMKLLLELSTIDESRKNSLQYNILFARALVQTQQIEKAEKLMKSLLTWDEDITQLNEVKLLLGKLYQRSSRWDDAQKYLLEIISDDSKHAGAFALLGKVAIGRDSNTKLGRSYLEKAVALSPEDHNLVFEYSMALINSGEFELAKENFDRCGQLNSQLDRKLVGKVYLHFKLFDWAQEEFEQHLLSKRRENSDDVEAVLLLAYLKEMRSDNDAALNLYEAAIKIAPYNAIAHASLAMLLLGTGNRNFAAINACGLNQKEALLHLRAAYQLDPSMKEVKEAIEFCEKELTEVKQWNERSSKQKNMDTATVSRGGSSVVNKFFAQQLSSILTATTKVLLPVANHVNSFIIRLFQLVGLENHAKRFQMDFSFMQKADRAMSGRHHGSDRSRKIAIMKKQWLTRESNVNSVPRVAIQSVDQLMEYVTSHQPVIITNFQDGWGASIADQINSSATNTGTQLWRKHLMDTMGDDVVRVSISESGRFDGPEDGTLWGLDSNTDVLVRPPTTAMQMKDFLNLLDSETQETFYLEYSSFSQYLGQKIAALVPLPHFVSNSSLDPLVSNLWIGGFPTISPLHYDDYENFLCQIAGQKELILFPPEDFQSLYYVGRPKGKLIYEYPNKFTRDPATVDKRHGFVFGSSVNVDQPDFQSHPKFKQAHPVRALLNPGDALYLPSFWHHEVQSIPEVTFDSSQLNVAVNFWFANVTTPLPGM